MTGKPDPRDLVCVGAIAGAFGVQGEVRLKSFCAEPEDIALQLQQVQQTDPDPAVQTFKREGQKIGRNDPCPCGSGKKYKKCHGAAEA